MDRCSPQLLRTAALITAAVVATALGAPTVAAAAATKRSPALATGTSGPAEGEGTRSRWRLLGRRLTVALPKAVHPVAPANRVVVVHAQCGESTVVRSRSTRSTPGRR